MKKADFLQAKATFLLQYPDQDELAFCRYVTKHFPDAAIGWLSLGREWERRGQEDRALAAYRQAMRVNQTDAYADEAREAYHALLRKKRRATVLKRTRRIAGLLAFWLGLFVWPQPASDPLVASQTSGLHGPPMHTEVIAVPDGLSNQALEAQVKQFAKSRRPALSAPYTLLLVPEADGVPLYTPLLFYAPQQVRGVLVYDPRKQTFLSKRLFPSGCVCGQDPAVQTAKTALAKEQLVLEQVLTLRNAVYRTYQRTGRLPQKLSDLAQPYPANALSAIPALAAPAAVAANRAADGSPARQVPRDWTYNPSAFRPEQAWASMRNVVPLPDYPEPSVPLGPLQIYIYQSSYTLTLMSGSHPVRRYPIGIGKERLTPEGYFTILQKISRPQGHDHVYGSRGMIFANASYAIHGTNRPESIGQAQSLGCIRLYNPDVEELYSFVSPGTDVIISERQVPLRFWPNPSRFLLPAGPDEETPNVVYRWLH